MNKNKLIFIILSTISFHYSMAQKYSECTEEILKYSSPYFEILDTEEYIPYSATLDNTPYLDSILYNYSYLDYVLMLGDSTIKYIGGVSMDKILKYDKKDSIEAFIYESYQYENYIKGGGIWIAFSTDNGKNWSHYYTGIVQRKPLFIKWYSQRPLIINKNILQIDACLLCYLKPITLHGEMPNIDFIRDGIYIVFDIDKISLDSDGDGLTDIVEDRLRTDKYNSDTNGNGVSDFYDLNPRYKRSNSDLTKIYEAVLTHHFSYDYKEKNKINTKDMQKDYYANASTRVIQIVTDDPEILGVQIENLRIIFITEQEYEKEQINNIYNTGLRKYDISSLSKVESTNNYEIIIGSPNGGRVYTLEKINDSEWEFSLTDMWIH